MEHLAGFAPLAERYDGFVLDLWGVIHDGVTAFPHAVECLKQLHLAGKRTLLLSNVPRPNAAAQAMLRRMGIEDSLYTDILTSGEAVRLAWEHHAERVQAPPSVARRLRLEPGDDRVMCTRYLLTADGSPVQLATSYEPVAITAGTPVLLPEQGQFAGRGVIARMGVIGIQVDQVTEDIAVRPSQAAEAGALAIALGALVISVERAHHAADRVVEAGDIVIPADQYRLRYRLPVLRD